MNFAQCILAGIVCLVLLALLAQECRVEGYKDPRMGPAMDRFRKCEDEQCEEKLKGKSKEEKVACYDRCIAESKIDDYNSEDYKEYPGYKRALAQSFECTKNNCWPMEDVDEKIKCREECKRKAGLVPGKKLKDFDKPAN